MIGQTVSHYSILSKLGEGGMGVVYVAEDKHLGRRVAIKFLHAASGDHHYRARFLREARAISSLSHPNIATVYDYGETAEGQPFLVMELIEGETLDELLQASALTLWRAVEIVEYVAAALEEAHHHGIIHRDIKPSNVVVTERGQVKVLDFGLAKRINEENHQETDPNAKTLLATHTRDGVVVGTPLYLSPEQATGANVDGRSDLFALGALLYECIAGKPAFSGGSVIEIGAQVLHIDPPPPSEINPNVPPDLDRITLKALAKKPAERYQTANEMRRDLNAVRAMLSPDAETVERISPPRGAGSRTSALLTLTDTLRRPRFSVFTVVATSLAVILLIGGILWFKRTKQYQPPEEARSFYEKGTNFLREGAYYQASKALERAISIDERFALAHARLAEAWMELDYAEKAKEELLRANALVPDRAALSEEDRLYLDAINAIGINNYELAINDYHKLVEAEPEKPQSYVDLGRAYEKNEQVDQALDSYVKATTKDGQYATAYLRAAILHIRKRNSQAASLMLDMAANLYQALSNSEGGTEVLYWRGVMLTNKGDLAEARAPLEQALKQANDNGNESQKINALLQLGRLSYNEGAAEKAREYANEALDFAEKRGLDNLATLALLDLGNAFTVNNNYDRAEEYLKRALGLAQRNKAQRLEALSKLYLGNVYMQRLRTDEALTLVQQALDFFRQGNYQRQISFCLTHLGRGHRRKGQYQAALQAFEQKLELDKAADDKRQIAIAYSEIAMVHTKQERYPETLRFYEESYPIYKSMPDSQSMAYNRMNRGNVLWQLGRYEDADVSLGEASSLADKPDGGYKAVLAEIKMIRAQAALSKRQFPEAKENSLRALEEAGTFYPDVTIGAKIALGLAQARSGAAREGKRLCEEALSQAEQTGEDALISDAMLALAEALYESGDAGGALTRALQVQERLARAGEQESEWRAWLIAARSSFRKGNQQEGSEQLARSKDAFTKLQQLWGAEAFGRYQARPDIQVLRKQLSGELAAAL